MKWLFRLFRHPRCAHRWSKPIVLRTFSSDPMVLNTKRTVVICELCGVTQ